MKRYFTVKNPSAADKAAASSFVDGTDASGTEYAFVKLNDGVPVPAWDGSAVEVSELEAPAASQSALYRPAAGPDYRAVCSAFGGGLVNEFVASTTSTLPAPVLAELLDYLQLALASALGGYITTLREILVNLAPLDPGFSAATKAALLLEIDAFLDKFPGSAGRFDP